MRLAERLKAAREAEAKADATVSACRKRSQTIDADFHTATDAVKATKTAFAEGVVRLSIGDCTDAELLALRTAHEDAVARYDAIVTERDTLATVKRKAEVAYDRAQIEAHECRRLMSLEILDAGLADRLREAAKAYFAVQRQVCEVLIAGHHTRGDAIFILGRPEDDKSIPGIARKAGVYVNFERLPYLIDSALVMLSDERLASLLTAEPAS